LERFGQLEVDRLLVATSDLIRRTFRNSDIVGRIGLDEFGVALLESQKEGAGLAIQRLASAVESYNAAGPKIPVALSVGAAVLDAGAKREVEELMARAEMARLEQEREFAGK